MEFTTPRRKQTRRDDVQFRTAALEKDDVTIVDGLPVTTVERTIADLVRDDVGLDHVSNALRDAFFAAKIDAKRLEARLAPLAGRCGCREGDGAALLGQLREVAGIDTATIARRLAEQPEFDPELANVIVSLSKTG